VTVESADGRTVTVDDVSRILPLWGNISEIVFGLGLGDNVVGRDVSATFDEASDLPMVTRAHDVSAESVLSLRPSVVLASDQTGPAEALDHIRDVGIPVVVFEEPVGVDDIVPRIHAVAQALGVEAAGDRLAASVEAELEAVRDEVPSGNETSVAFLYMRGQAGVYLIAGPGSGADSMIEAAGALDAGTQMGLDRPFTPLTSEALVKAAPDVILMTTTGLESVGGLDGLLEIPGIKQTPAGRDARIVTIEDGLLYSFGPRTPRTIAELSREIFGGS
jgi:iron complex transport system substrate-binding protein